MPEHTPAPTPSRAVYGFALYLTMKSCFFAYVVWSIVPDDILLLLNLYYLPQKYWAIAVPVQVLVVIFVFAFFIYPGMNLCLSPNFDDNSTVTDKAAIFRCCYQEDGYKCHEIIKDDKWITENLCSKHMLEKPKESTKVVTNKKTKRYCDCINKSKCMALNEPSFKKPVEPVTEIPLSEVNKILYL
ncbi:phosphatidylinositol N-acetylglucosaminyltransferase subunit P-like isoform X1 [Ctenocephalides felis]|uniref:phosphatidylinositol N-acetylglucosaminyltransferase subunit P-like isoform X1 n=1 Tax=Ctenocephalides felis TaxID=7515 RepID=UPI000E6E178C|nr:phosphatidylinositol N-acetylglucosaminyltransferase subunit P-like isoform X1 [Ctenocephalides felis]